ncbi:hypothetical protein FOA43_004031 [Brettanomyces nanus]|uniref:Uncharacterized protein n=1 Tax=Eeniella nana TaxID=13502 RepID=A0A875SAP3_EENNA|nr:uncharacterized protein FOA43_004031 [Brettanomyces nanus]QPG76639.1 hypothetical protein FOA43_004031 [Brettanomyces nanus]
MPFDTTRFEPLVEELLSALESSLSYRILVLIIGRPGSGKTTISQYLEDQLNERYRRNDNKLVPFSSDYFNLQHLDFTKEFEAARPLPIDLEEAETQINHDIDNPDFPSIPYNDSTTLKIIGRGLLSTLINVKTESAVSIHHPIPPFAKHISMDGFHLPRSVLGHMTNSQNMFLRRGFPDSFDSDLVVKLVQLLTDICYDTTVTAAGHQANLANALWMFDSLPGSPSISIPDFDHRLKDPTPDASIIAPSTRVIILEGNYLMLNQGRWAEISEIVRRNKQNNVLVWKVVPANKDEVRERTAKRHVTAGICNTLDEGYQRYDANDKLNGDLIDDSSNNEYIDKFIVN